MRSKKTRLDYCYTVLPYKLTIYNRIRKTKTREGQIEPKEVLQITINSNHQRTKNINETQFQNLRSRITSIGFAIYIKNGSFRDDLELDFHYLRGAGQRGMHPAFLTC